MQESLAGCIFGQSLCGKGESHKVYVLVIGWYMSDDLAVIEVDEKTGVVSFGVDSHAG